ncbi:hypothetical protein HY311_02945 [Candidatus Nomurabacteria bacterium]|nr:hypothetical protein [Candidatus Nomurabacteria bacterium]
MDYLTVLLSGIVIGLLLNMLFAYLSRKVVITEKGEPLATKKDVSKISSEIENLVYLYKTKENVVKNIPEVKKETEKITEEVPEVEPEIDEVSEADKEFYDSVSGIYE